MKHALLCLLSATSLLLSACAGPGARDEGVAPFEATVIAVRAHQLATREASGINTLAGAAAGGVLGHQVGEGKGKKAATIAGALGGALVGSQIGQRTRMIDQEALTLQMPDGRLLEVDVPAAGFRPGQKVLVSVRGRQAEIRALP